MHLVDVNLNSLLFVIDIFGVINRIAPHFDTPTVKVSI
jgi:hypothetical protein